MGALKRLLLFCAMGCTLAGALPAAAQAPASAAPFDIPVILPLTGLGAFLGLQEQTSLNILTGLLNREGGIHGRPVKFTIQDDESVPQSAVQLLGNVLASHPQVILGSTIVAECAAMAPLLRNGPFDYCYSPAIHPPAGSFMFAANVSSTDAVNVMVRYLRLKGLTHLALIATSDASGQDGEHGTMDALKLPENAGVSIVAVVHYAPTDVSIAAQLAQLQAQHPQAIIAQTTGTPMATLLRGLAQAGIDLPVASAFGNMTYTQMNAYAGFMPKQLIFASAAWPEHAPGLLDPAVEKAQAAFRAAYKTAGERPDNGASNAWDATRITVAALRALGPDATAEQLRAWVANLADFPGVNGRYDFRKTPQRGLDESEIVMSRWDQKAGTWMVISHPGGAPLEK